MGSERKQTHRLRSRVQNSKDYVSKSGLIPLKFLTLNSVKKSWALKKLSAQIPELEPGRIGAELNRILSFGLRAESK